MKYDDSLEKSAEYLRLAVQQMTKQATALHPLSYAVWYEYVSGRNAALNVAVDGFVQQNTVLDEKTTAEVFRKYIAEIDAAAAEKIASGFQKVMENISKSADEAGDEAARFGDVLEHWTGTAQVTDSDLSDLLLHTRSMQGSIGTLKNKLEESHQEIERLRDEVVKARQDAMSDGLTGLVNRKGFDMALARCIEASSSSAQGPSLLITDIDFFKRVNDTYGHIFGDKVISAVAQILKANVKGQDTAARYGGEEFVVLLPETSLAGAQQLAEKIRMTVEKLNIKRNDKNEVISNITISLGVASYRKGESMSEFIARADGALYRSKTEGRNRVSIASSH